MNGRVEIPNNAQLLRPAGPPGVGPATGPLPEKWQLELSRQRRKMLARQVGDELVMILAEHAATPLLQSVPGCNVGVSAPPGSGLRVPEALREARLAKG